LTFEDTGLPNKDCYRKAFDKGFKTMVKTRSPETNEDEAVKLFLDVCVTPALFACDMGLEQEQEEKVVKVLLQGQTFFESFTDKEMRHLMNAFALGIGSWAADIDDYKKKTVDMTPVERMVVQIGIYSLMKMSCDEVRPANDDDDAASLLKLKQAATSIFRSTEKLMDVYNAVSQREFSDIDDKIQEKHRRIKNIGDSIVVNPGATPDHHKNKPRPPE